MLFPNAIREAFQTFSMFVNHIAECNISLIRGWTHFGQTYKGYHKRSYNNFLEQVFEGYPVQTNRGKLALRSLISIDTFHRVER